MRTKTLSSGLSFISSTERVVITEATSPMLVSTMTSLRTLAEKMLFTVPGSWLRMLCSIILSSVALEHHLDASNNFIELIFAKCRIHFPEIRPGMNVVDHQLEIVPMDVVVDAAGDGTNTIVAFLPRI